MRVQQPPRLADGKEKSDADNASKTNKSVKGEIEQGQKEGEEAVMSGGAGTGLGPRSGSGTLSPMELLSSDPLVDRAVFDRVNDMLHEVHTLRHGVVSSSSSGNDHHNNMISSVLSSAPISARLLAQSLSLATTSALAAHVTAQVTHLVYLSYICPLICTIAFLHLLLQHIYHCSGNHSFYHSYTSCHIFYCPLSSSSCSYNTYMTCSVATRRIACRGTSSRGSACTRVSRCQCIRRIRK